MSAVSDCGQWAIQTNIFDVVPTLIYSNSDNVLSLYSSEVFATFKSTVDIQLSHIIVSCVDLKSIAQLMENVYSKSITMKPCH